MSRAVLVLAVLSAIAGGTSCSSDESGSPSAPIAFFRGQELLLIDPDGTNERSLAHFRSQLYDRFGTTWSPNGRHILVSFQLDNRFDIHVVEADGSGQRRLWRAGPSTGDPLWSPRGDAILIEDATDDRSAMWIVTPDGKARRLPIGEAFGNPVWSPDGRKIAYDGPHGLFVTDTWIYVMNADGNARTRITKGAVMDWAPSKLIWFIDDDDDLWVVKPDGSGRRRATKAEERLEESPEGSTVIEQKWTSGDEYDLYVKDLTDGNSRKLTRGCCAKWSPDRRSLVFVRSGDIYVINVDGTGERNLTDSPQEESWPVWSPRASE